MSQRDRLFVLLSAVTIPMFALAAAFVLTSVQESRDSAERDALHLARAGVLATESFFEGHQQTLRAIARDFRDARDLSEPELRGRLVSVSETSPEWDGISVVGPDGVVLAGSRETSAGADLSARPYLQQLFRSGQPVISEGVVTAVEGVPAVVIATPVEFEDGTQGALAGSVSLETLSEALVANLTTAARVGLVDHLGQTLAHPDAARVAELGDVGDRMEIVAALAGESGVVEVDRGDERTLVAYAPVPSLGWAVTVAEPTSTAFAAADAIGRRGTVLVSIAAVGVMALGWYLGGRLNRSYMAMQDAQLAEAAARHRAEAALQSRDEFISIASHELRNPVAAVRGYGQLMQRRLARDDLREADLREYVDSILKSGTYLSRLVEDLLSVSRLEGGRLDLHLQEADLSDVLQRALAEAPLVGHPVRVEQPAGPLIARVDADRITQILVNFLENAAKYSPEGSEILLRVRLRGGELSIAVTDSGIGLPAEDIPRLFTPFGRATNAREANIPGLGLGLYVSRRLAEAHGGALQANSGGNGLGSTFTLFLPTPPQPSSRDGHHEARPDDEPGVPVEAAGKAST